jgi:hypothetical protein
MFVRWLVIALATSSCATTQVVKLLKEGSIRQLRDERVDPIAPRMPRVLILALDGFDRDLLYGALKSGRLPALAALLFAEGETFPHAYFEPRLLATLPSTTITGWATTFTGVPPSEHGVSGNEFFMRETRTFAAPIPSSFADGATVLATFTEDYVNDLLRAPTLYERLREREPEIEIWVAMNQIYRGADRLLLTDRAAVLDGFREFVVDRLLHRDDEDEVAKKAFAKVDLEVIETLVQTIERDGVPDVLTLYAAGTDLYAHISDGGPDRSRIAYLTDVLEPAFAQLFDELDAERALDDTYVVIVSDHGHTEVLHDEHHALFTGEDDPPGVLEKAGFRLRPFALEVDRDHDFQAVFAYQGAIAFVYLADRSLCPDPGTPCDWSRPARFREDVLDAAEAFFLGNQSGSKMKGAIDLTFVRETDGPFSVYLGNGRTMPITEYLSAHPRPEYVALEWRLSDLTSGPMSAHAGDVLLLAHNGDRDRPEDRYYFASSYRSWHGSPSRKDSEIPLIVAHRKKSAKELRSIVAPILGDKPFQQKVTDVVMKLRTMR